MKKYDVTVAVVSPRDEDFMEFRIAEVEADTEKVARVFALSYAKEMISMEIVEIKEIK